jgi:hypothetical protein
MDFVTITDPNLGLSNYPVRVIEIEEDDKGLLAFTCEELVTGVSNPALNPNASSNGFQPNFAVSAVPINQPLIVEPPTSLTGGVSQIWLGASGIGAGFNGQWGGAVVWLSVDGVTYAQVVTLGAPLRQGFLTSSLPAAAGWDSVDTLAVDLTESGGTLSGTSQGAAQQGGTLSLVDGEFLGYEAATLTTAGHFNLTGLARGLGGSSPAPHSTGAPFARLDGAVGRYDLPANLAGKMLFFKFQSFNTLGGGVQDLSTCTVYTYAASAPSVLNPIFAQLETGFPLDLGQVTDTPTLSDDFGSVTVTASSSLDLGAITVPVVHPIAALLLLGSPVDLGLITSAVTLSDDFGSTNDAVVDVINLGTVP